MSRFPFQVAMLLLATMVVLVPNAEAESSVHVIVPRNAPWFDLPLAELLPNEPAGTEIVSWVSTSRGTLVATTGKNLGFTYIPDTPFRSLGSDSFRITYAQNEMLQEATVFLVADLGPPASEPSEFDGDTTSGGNTVVELDLGKIAESPCCNPAPVFEGPLAQGGATGSPVGYLLTMIHTPGGHAVEVRATLRDGTEVVSDPIPVEGVVTITLDWWLADHRTRNGGVLVRRDRELVAALTGLDNHHADGIAWVLDQEARTDVGGPIEQASHHARSNATPLPYPARFADTFEDGLASTWDQGIGAFGGASQLTVVGSAALDGTFGLAASIDGGLGSFLEDQQPDDLDNYRARFRLDLETCSAEMLNAASGAVLIEGRSEETAASVFRVMLVTDSGQHWLYAIAKNANDGTWAYAGVPLSHPEAVVDVAWWRGDQPGTAGGLILRLDQEALPTVQLEAFNADLTLDSIRFGAFGAPGQATGTVCLDEFESWWR